MVPRLTPAKPWPPFVADVPWMERELGREPLAIRQQQRRCADGTSAGYGICFYAASTILPRNTERNQVPIGSRQADRKRSAKTCAMIGCNPSATIQLRLRQSCSLQSRYLSRHSINCGCCFSFALLRNTSSMLRVFPLLGWTLSASLPPL
jgi:hypothetical protein